MMSTHFLERKRKSPGTILYDLSPIISLIMSPVFFFFFTPSLHISHTDFPAVSPAQLCTCGACFTQCSFTHVCPAKSLLGSKSWLTSQLLNDSLPNHSNPTLLVLLTLLFLSFPYLWSSNILYNMLIIVDYLLCVPQQNVSITRPANCVWNNV